MEDSLSYGKDHQPSKLLTFTSKAKDQVLARHRGGKEPPTFITYMIPGGRKEAWVYKAF